MATYNSLTQEQVDDAAIHYQANGIGAILNSLDAGAQVPNASGLAGSQALTKEELQAAVTDMSALLASYYTDAKRQVYDKMVGPYNSGR